MIDVSIVIISFNTREITIACLESIIENCKNCKLEIIVVDNCSSDGSKEAVARQFPNVRLICNSDNLGFAAANNQAFKVCSGKYVLLLNSDTVILGDVLAQSMLYMDQHLDVGVFGCRVLNPDLTMQKTCFMYPTFLNLLLMTTGLSKLPWPKVLGRASMSHWKRDSDREVEVVTGCYMLVRKEAMDQVGWLDDSFFFCGEETDWCYRMKKAGWRICFSPVGEIVHIGNASGRRFEARRDIMLTQGIVRFNRKQFGFLIGGLAYCLLFVFCATHWIFWAVICLLSRTDHARQRRDHFRQVVVGFSDAWPKMKLSVNQSAE